MNINIIVHTAQEGGYWAELPALPRLRRQGETMNELMANIHEAIRAWRAAAP